MHLHPMRILKIYYVLSLAAGIVMTFFLAHWVDTKEIGARGAAVMTVCLNVFLIMLLPLVLDWAERKYFQARFLLLEEVAETNPELALILDQQCKKLEIPNLKLAVVHSPVKELFSYGLWRNNPRLVVSDSLLAMEQVNKMIPSIEAELLKFASQDRPFIFLAFGIVEEILLVLLLSAHAVR
jgi:Zn-dependent protease with chaperone function